MYVCVYVSACKRLQKNMCIYVSIYIYNICFGFCQALCLRFLAASRSLRPAAAKAAELLGTTAREVPEAWASEGYVYRLLCGSCMGSIL